MTSRILGIVVGGWIQDLSGGCSFLYRSGAVHVGRQIVCVVHAWGDDEMHQITVSWPDVGSRVNSGRWTTYEAALSSLRRELVGRGHAVYGPSGSGDGTEEKLPW